MVKTCGKNHFPSGRLVSCSGRQERRCWQGGLGAESEEKHEPASDIDPGVVDSLKVLDLKRPIREADIGGANRNVRFGAKSGHLRHRADYACLPDSVRNTATRGKMTLISVNTPGCVSTSIAPPCCLTTMS